ncbi:group I truncated hemoglobin [Oceanimonas baumannii]|uniref:Hemoglobin n=2 Tax=Oceanimonas baumannii TaxID=129578 RepID=A0ABY2EWQ5_9GAMM|nr:group 1 truncated hemoglobin [Oceanimonas baumannii]TDW57664.1 hemoglobin [Oceanimonas baumannii]
MKFHAMRSLHVPLLSILALLTCLSLSAQESAGEQTESLYQRLGGLVPISVVVSDFIDVVVDDDIINANPAVKAARTRAPAPYLSYQVTAQVCYVTGGPCQYLGRSMKEAHGHLNITEAEWAHMVALFEGVLDQHQVPARERQELLDIVASTKGEIVMAP